MLPRPRDPGFPLSVPTSWLGGSLFVCLSKDVFFSVHNQESPVVDLSAQSFGLHALLAPVSLPVSMCLSPHPSSGCRSARSARPDCGIEEAWPWFCRVCSSHSVRQPPGVFSTVKLQPTLKVVPTWEAGGSAGADADSSHGHPRRPLSFPSMTSACPPFA